MKPVLTSINQRGAQYSLVFIWTCQAAHEVPSNLANYPATTVISYYYYYYYYYYVIPVLTISQQEERNSWTVVAATTNLLLSQSPVYN